MMESSQSDEVHSALQRFLQRFLQRVLQRVLQRPGSCVSTGVKEAALAPQGLRLKGEPQRYFSAAVILGDVTDHHQLHWCYSTIVPERGSRPILRGPRPQRRNALSPRREAP